MSQPVKASMKVSELIERLQAEQARHGDVEVQVVTAKTELLPITLVTYDIYVARGELHPEGAAVMDAAWMDS